MDRKPLDGFKILDLTNGLAGPTAGALLGDYGADVISIEPPAGGSQRKLAGGGAFPNVSRNKRFIAVDLKTQRGKDVLHDLVANADALLHNVPPSRAKKFECDYETVSEINSSLVYCSITGFGESGPYKDRPGIDSIAQAMSGLMWATGEPDRKPSRVGGGTIDVGAGFLAAFSVVTALMHAFRTGEGQKVEVSLLDTAAAIMGGSYTNYDMTGDAPKRSGDSTSKYAPCGVFNTKTDPIYLAVPFQYIWERLCEVVDREDWIRDSRFETNEKRLENKDELEREIESEFQNYERDVLLEILLDEFIVASELNSVSEAVEDEHLRQRGTVQEVETSDGETVLATTTPVQFSQTPGETSPVCYPIGAHTCEVLTEFGYEGDEIEALVEGEIVSID